MPRTRKEMASDARAVAWVLEDAGESVRSEEIQRRLGATGRELTIKQIRRTLELAERIHLIRRVNRSRWGAAGTVPSPSPARRSRADAVIDAASRLLELPASTDLNRAVRAVLRLATDQAGRPVLSRQAPRVPTPAATPDAPAPFATQERKANGAHDQTGQVEVLIDAHP